MTVHDVARRLPTVAELRDLCRFAAVARSDEDAHLKSPPDGSKGPVTRL
ncbi:hypothetical protein ACGFYY_09545 [Streptomyces sp. NPDC048331]